MALFVNNTNKIKMPKRMDSIMNKRAIFILGLVTLFFVSVYIGAKIEGNNKENTLADDIELSKEAENIPVNDVSLSIDSREEKTTPNTKFVLKKYYTQCNHLDTEEAELPEEMVNMTREELAKKYTNWEIEEFSKDEVVLCKKLDKFCSEHYLIIVENDEIMIYSLDKEGNKELKEKCDIAYEYLPETDKIILRDGIYVYGLQELNKIKEDFES